MYIAPTSCRTWPALAAPAISGALALLVAGCGRGTASVAPPTAVDAATVSLHVEGHRPFIELTFRRPDGSRRRATFLVDTGGGGFLLTAPLAADLGLVLGPVTTEEGHAMARVASAVSAFVAG